MTDKAIDIRLHVARFFDRVLPRACWINLFCWAYFGEPSLWRAVTKDNRDHCVEPCKYGVEGRRSCCYCGKIRCQDCPV